MSEINPKENRPKSYFITTSLLPVTTPPAIKTISLSAYQVKAREGPVLNVVDYRINYANGGNRIEWFESAKGDVQPLIDFLQIGEINEAFLKLPYVQTLLDKLIEENIAK